MATLLEPLELLSFIHEVELSLNRERKIHWGPRTIDIDIIFYDDLEMQEENLVIPHKEAFNRLFVLKPIFELIDKDFKYYASIEKAIAELSVSEQELHVIKEEKTPRNRIEDAVKEILFAVGENPNREGLLETPARVAKMYEEILSSQRLSKFNEYKLFEIDSSKTDSIVFEYRGPSPEAVLDRLPTAVVVSRDRERNTCTVRAEVFGDGIDMWLRSQGEQVRVISRKVLGQTVTGKENQNGGKGHEI